MNDRARVLIVDDSVSEIRLLMEVLRDEFAVVAATSAEQALAQMARSQPDLVLMDAVMEPVDGYQLCRQMLEASAAMPVIFVSANSRSEEILKGYDAGGKDYLAKPIDPEVLRNRIRFCLQQVRELEQLHADKAQVSSMALAALGNAADIGIVLNFVREAIRIGNQAQLAQRLIRTLGDYGLVGLVQVRSGDQFWNCSTSGQVAALEAEILRRSCFMDRRLFSQGNRLMISYDFVTLLIKNHPGYNPRRAGELCDYLTILAENANDLIGKIRDERALTEQRVSLLLDALRDSQGALTDIQNRRKRQEADSMLLLSQLSLEMEEEFAHLDLTRSQENAILAIIEGKLQESMLLVQQSSTLDQQLQKIADSLGELTRSF